MYISTPNTANLAMISPITHRPMGLHESTRAPPLGNLSIIAILLWIILGGLPVRAADLYAADGFDVRWDNTLDYSAEFRVSPRNFTLLYNPNSDDGDRNFAPGLISNRLDLLSVFDLSRDDFGAHVSVAAWYDTVYHTRTANDSPTTYNPISVPNTQFARAVRNLDGQFVDIGDTFAYGNFAIDGMPVSMRVGRQTLLWGESLFFDENSIAAAQVPVDYIKAISAPAGYSKDVFLPVNQISLTVQPRPDVALAIYYQIEWRASRLPGVGSYFSYTDALGAGDERLLLEPGQFLLHGEDQTPSTGGQFGVSLHTTVNDLDLGLYALRFDAKYPILQLEPNINAVPSSGNVGEFELVYPTGIELYGASFSSYLGDSNIAGEFSARRHMPLVSLSSIPLYSTVQLSGFADKGYAEGDTLHAQVSSVTTLAPAPAWNSADLSVEIAVNDLLGVTQNERALDPSRNRFATNIRALFEPHYFEVLPHLDVTLSLGIGYNVVGRSSTDYTQNSGAGDFEAGISVSYLSVWKANLALTSFLGTPSSQPLADRDFISMSVERTF